MPATVISVCPGLYARLVDRSQREIARGSWNILRTRAAAVFLEVATLPVMAVQAQCLPSRLDAAVVERAFRELTAVALEPV